MQIPERALTLLSGFSRVSDDGPGRRESTQFDANRERFYDLATVFSAAWEAFRKAKQATLKRRKRRRKKKAGDRLDSPS